MASFEIIQGSNEPLLFTFREETPGSFQGLSVALLRSYLPQGQKECTVLKHWDAADLLIEDQEVCCPLTEAETLAFPAGLCRLLVKWQASNGYNNFAEEIFGYILPHDDRTALTEVDTGGD